MNTQDTKKTTETTSSRFDINTPYLMAHPNLRELILELPIEIRNRLSSIPTKTFGPDLMYLDGTIEEISKELGLQGCNAPGASSQESFFRELHPYHPLCAYKGNQKYECLQCGTEFTDLSKKAGQGAIRVRTPVDDTFNMWLILSD